MKFQNISIHGKIMLCNESKGNNSKMGDNLDKKKDTGHLFFH